MRKNLAKHAAKQLPLAKRVLALCFALIFVCSCLLPAFANGTGTEFDTPDTEVTEEVSTEPEPVDEELTVDEPTTLDEDFAVEDEPVTMDDSYGISTQPVMDGGFGVDSGFGVDADVSTQDEVSQPVGGIDLPAASDPTPVVVDTPVKEGAANITTDKDGNIVYEYDTSDVTFPDDGVISFPDGDHALDKVDAAFAIPTNTYRFWLSKKDSYDLAEITREAKAADMTEDEYLSLHGESLGLFHMMYVADGGNMEDYKFTSPTSVDDPEGNSRSFAGWYYTDDLGDEHKFVFDQFLYTSEAKTVDVYAKWKDGTEKYENWYSKLLNSSDEETFVKLVKECFADSKFVEYLSELSTNEQKVLWEKMYPETSVEATYEMDEDDGIALFTIVPSGNGQKTVSVNGTVELVSKRQGSSYYGGTHTWSSSDESIATVSSGGYYNYGYYPATYSATVTGKKSGTVVITHTWTKDGVTYTDTATIMVSGTDDQQAYFLYCYTLIPGVSLGTTGDPNNIWNGMGVGSVSGLGAPSNYNYADKVDNGYGSSGATIAYPSEYPDITVDGKTYTYASDTSPNRFKEGYYTITWFYIIRSKGANAGNNNYNVDIDQSIPTYHLDGQITLNEKDIYTVDFKLRDAGESSFELVEPEKYSKRVSKGTLASTLSVPTTTDVNNYPQTKWSGNIEYIFDGWYDNENCEGDPIDFKTYVINQNTTFYGKYIPKDNVVPDDAYINIEKRFTGITEREIPADFMVRVGTRFLRKRDAVITEENGAIVLRWKIENATAGSYDVTEFGEAIDGYIVEKGGDIDKTVNVENAKFEAIGNRITPNKERDFKVGTSDGKNWVFVVSTTDNSNAVVSKEKLSAGERAAVVKAITSLNGAIGHQDNYFYSIKENETIVLDGATITYSDYNSTIGAPGIHIAAQKMWNMVAEVSYSITDASRADILITNTYTPNTSDLTVTKTVTGFLGDREKEFRFTLSFDKEVDPSKITWKKSDDSTGTLVDQTYTFTLAHGQSIVFHGIPAGVMATVTEDNYEDYTTTYKIHNTSTIIDLSSPVGDRTASVTIDATARTIQFLNHNDADPDMGVLLDTLPYILILAVVVGGGVLLFLRKRKNDDDDE